MSGVSLTRPCHRNPVRPSLWSKRSSSRRADARRLDSCDKHRNEGRRISPPSPHFGSFGNTPRRTTPPSVLPDISPSRGEIELLHRVAPNSGGIGHTKGAACRSPPLEGEMPGRAEGGMRHIQTRPSNRTAVDQLREDGERTHPKNSLTKTPPSQSPAWTAPPCRAAPACRKDRPHALPSPPSQTRPP